GMGDPAQLRVVPGEQRHVVGDREAHLRGDPRSLLMSADRPTAIVYDNDIMAEAVRYLAALGHRRIARVGGPVGLGHSTIRATAFASTMRELGLDEGRQIATGFDGSEGARATRSRHGHDVVVVDDGRRTVGRHQEGAGVAAEMGFAVPDDVSLLAWDDSQLCRITHPTLSAMSHDVHSFGAQVARTLFAVIEGEHTGSVQVPTPSLT
ncbi:LacI family transcriptional regulator, partial [Streptomyces sp. or43]